MSVSTHLTKIASALILSSNEKTSIFTSISTLESRLSFHFDSNAIKETFLFGSYTRGTILPRDNDSKSDIDYMIIFDNSSSYKPQTFLNRLKGFVDNRYSSSEIRQSHPTIVLELNHIMFDLVPAYKLWNKLYIPAPSNYFFKWIETDPTKFKSDLEKANSLHNSELKRLIRLVKYWNVLNDCIYSSYELEKKIVNSYIYGSNLKEYFYCFFENINTYSLSTQWRVDKVNRAKLIIANTKQYEQNYASAEAEQEIKKIIPPI